MAGNNLWLTYPAAVANVLTTQLNALADGSVTALSSEIDNSTNQHLYCDFQVDLISLNIASTTAFLHIFIVPTVDGTNYPDWTSGAAATYHSAYLRGVILVQSGNSAHRVNFEEIRIPPGKYKVAIRNGLGVAMATSDSSTVAARPYSVQYT